MSDPIQIIPLTPEQENMLAQLQAVKNAVESSKIRCNNCGSDLHSSCSSSGSR